MLKDRNNEYSFEYLNEKLTDARVVEDIDDETGEKSNWVIGISKGQELWYEKSSTNRYRYSHAWTGYILGKK